MKSSQDTHDSEMHTGSDEEWPEDIESDESEEEIETLYEEPPTEKGYKNSKKISWSFPPTVQEFDPLDHKNDTVQSTEYVSSAPNKSSNMAGQNCEKRPDMFENTNGPSNNNNNYSSTCTEIESEQGANTSTPGTSHLQLGNRTIRKIPPKFTLIAKSKENVRTTIQQRGYEMI